MISKLVEIRKASGLTQVEVASRMGTAQPRVAEFETAVNRRVNLETVVKYAEAVGADIEIVKREFKGEVNE